MSKRFLGYPEGLYEAGAHVWGYTLLNLTAAAVILAAFRGELSWLGHPVLAYLGKISYGIYLFQRPVLALYETWLAPRVLAALRSELLALIAGFPICAGCVVALAATSYHFFEAPLLAYVAPAAVLPSIAFDLLRSRPAYFLRFLMVLPMCLAGNLVWAHAFRKQILQTRQERRNSPADPRD